MAIATSPGEALGAVGELLFQPSGFPGRAQERVRLALDAGSPLNRRRARRRRVPGQLRQLGIARRSRRRRRTPLFSQCPPASRHEAGQRQDQRSQDPLPLPLLGLRPGRRAGDHAQHRRHRAARGRRHPPSLNWGLLGVRCATWNGVVFINIDGYAPSLDAVTGPIQERLASFDFAFSRAKSPFAFSRSTPIGKSKSRRASKTTTFLTFTARRSLPTPTTTRPSASTTCSWVSTGATADRRGSLATAERSPSRTRPADVAVGGGSGQADSSAAAVGRLVVDPDDGQFHRRPAPVDRSTVARTKTWFIGEGMTSAKYRRARGQPDLLRQGDGGHRGDGMLLQQMSHVRDDLGLQTRFSPYWERSLQNF